MRRRDAATRRTQRTRLDVRQLIDNKTIDVEWRKNHSTLPEFFIFHSSFIIMRCLRILIIFWARTLVDEICQLLRKSSNDQGKAHSATVLWRHGSAASASLRPTGVTCITQASLAARASRALHLVYIFNEL